MQAITGSDSAALSAVGVKDRQRVRVAKRDSETLDRFVMEKEMASRQVSSGSSTAPVGAAEESRRRADSVGPGAGGSGGGGKASASANQAAATLTEGKPRRRYTDTMETPV